MEISKEVIPELQPVFAFLNSHTNKLYQEGYFLKLDDQDIKGNPNPDRTWTECFAQLVGTVLSLWDAAELDAAGEDGEVLPKFINLTDASIKMIESLPTRSDDEQPLQNILSISTAGRNRYLLHFNSHHSLIQWTSGIRLAMFEHSTLQEAYTGALVAGKGKVLNNIGVIMERARVPIQEWVRVRFGAGVPWRRCWCVIEPPNEKEYQKAQKDLKKRSPYDRSHAPLLKGEIRFYDSKKDAEKKKKHSQPIATITDAFSAYAIYPQSKALIDGSTLLKVEGQISIHAEPPSTTEGFVFIMPEVPPAVSGFEMLLRFLFPTWDVFGLYGRPGRLVASVLDPRSLMFGMPKHKKYGYLEILDVSGLILTEGSMSWSERDWRKKLKEITGQRMAAVEEGGAQTHSRSGSSSSKRLSFGPQNPVGARPRVGFTDESASNRSSRSLSLSRPGLRMDSAPPDPNRERAPSATANHSRHTRNSSDTQLGDIPPSLGFEGPGASPLPLRTQDRVKGFASDLASTPERLSSEDESPGSQGQQVDRLGEMRHLETPEPVNAPPGFSHGPGSRPQQAAQHSPDLRRQNNRLSNATLSQLATANGLNPEAFAHASAERQADDWRMRSPPAQTDPRGPAVQQYASANLGMNANFNGSREALTSPASTGSSRPSPRYPPPDMGLSSKRSNSPLPGPNTPGGGPSHMRPGPQMGPPPHSGGRGTPPVMSPRGPPPDGRGFPGARDPRMGPPGPPGGYPPYQGGPPSGGRRTPPPNQGMPRSPHVQGASPPINRKPLPARTTSLQSSESDGHSQQRPFNAGGPPPVPPHGTHRQNGDAGYFDDASSTASPDYASTRPSTDTQVSVDRDRPRAGVLKTTGTESAAPGSRENSTEYSIPDVNFGPTINYGASKVTSPMNQPAQPYTPSSGRKSPGPGPALSHFRQESNDTIRRSVAWQPGAAAVGTLSAENALSPEQFVHQRAVVANSPLHPHQRNPSSNTLTDYKTGPPTSPQKRPGSRGGNHSRHNSGDLLQNGRPLSQGTAAALSGGEVSSYLSAREQEHVARVTGSPLIAFSGNKNAGQQASGGLVGAIQARDREKAQMMAGIGGQAVAQAIDQRMREQNQQAQRAAQAAFAQQQAQLATQQYGAAPSPGMMGQMGGGAPSMYGVGAGPPPGRPGLQSGPGYGQPRPQMLPQQGSFANGGRPNGPNMGNLPHRPNPLQPPQGVGYGMQSGQPQSPGFQPPPQGQYTPLGGPGGARPETPGRMHQAF
ncbi:hypothetical protein OQA88_6773 [Cercophora sp. LCS_1]